MDFLRSIGPTLTSLYNDVFLVAPVATSSGCEKEHRVLEIDLPFAEVVGQGCAEGSWTGSPGTLWAGTGIIYTSTQVFVFPSLLTFGIVLIRPAG